MLNITGKVIETNLAYRKVEGQPALSLVVRNSFENIGTRLTGKTTYAVYIGKLMAGEWEFAEIARQEFTRLESDILNTK